MAIKLGPMFALPHYNLGIVLHEKKQVDQAIQVYRIAITLDSKYAMPHNNLGNALRERKQVDQAIEEYRRAIELDPKQPNPHINLGFVLRGNYAFVSQTTARHGTPPWVNAVLFAGVLMWEAAAAAALWWAAFAKAHANRRRVYAAFTIALSLWMAFMLADEVFMAYVVDGTHCRLLTAQLVSLLVIELVRDK